MFQFAMVCGDRLVVVRRRKALWALALGLALVSGSSPAEAQTDRIVFVSARDGNPEIYTVRVDGTGLARLTMNSAVDEFPSWSPDGQRIAFQSNRTGSFEIYVMNADGSNVTRRTFSGSYSEHPTWSPDGNTIAYSTLSNGSANIWQVGASSGSPSLLFSLPGWDNHPDWSPDGARLALTSDWYAYDFVQDIFLVNTDGSGFTVLTGNIFDHLDYLQPAWSPDGARLSLAIVRTTGIDQYITQLGVMNKDGSNLRPLALAALWTRSSWSPDGQRIVYTSVEGNVVWIDAAGGASVPIIANGRNADWQPHPTTTSVDAGGREQSLAVRVLSSPSRGPVRFAVRSHDTDDELNIYNVAGRLVARVPLRSSAEAHVVTWDWRQDGCAPGMHFARLRSASAPPQAAKFLILP